LNAERPDVSFRLAPLRSRGAAAYRVAAARYVR